MFLILETQEFETHLFLAQTSLNTHGSEGKLFCSTSCNPTPLAISLWYNGLEHYTFVDACRYICTSLNLEENVIFSWESYHMHGTEEERGRHRGALSSPLHNYFPSSSHSICIPITFSESLVLLQGMEMTPQK